MTYVLLDGYLCQDHLLNNSVFLTELNCHIHLLNSDLLNLLHLIVNLYMYFLLDPMMFLHEHLYQYGSP